MGFLGFFLDLGFVVDLVYGVAVDHQRWVLVCGGFVVWWLWVHYSGGGGGGGFTVVVVVVSFFLGLAARFWLLLWISLSFVMGLFWVFGGGGFPMGWLWVSLWWWWVYCSGRFALIFFFFSGLGFVGGFLFCFYEFG